jgi:hypothetical protein
MEETNFNRKAILAVDVDEDTESIPPPVGQPSQNQSDSEKAAAQEHSISNNIDTAEGQFRPRTNLTFLQKMKIIRRQDLQNDVPMMGMLTRPFVFFSLPIVVFSGFMYGAIVCYFNVLNGTASLILSSPPYNFSASIVGLSYVSCLIGVFFGYVFL